MTRNSLGSGWYQEPKHKVPIGCNCMIDDTWLHSLFCLFKNIFGLHSLNWRLIDKAGSVYFDDMNAHNYINNIPSHNLIPHGSSSSHWVCRWGVGGFQFSQISPHLMKVDQSNSFVVGLPPAGWAIWHCLCSWVPWIEESHFLAKLLQLLHALCSI